MKIPFHRSRVSLEDEKTVLMALRSGHTQGDGQYTKLCEAWLEDTLGTKRALLTSSGTDALEMAILLADVQAGDEVIMPSFTFVSTANAVVLRGATPVFVDIREDTLNLDESLITAAITSKTKAIIPVHYAGVGCDMQAMSLIAKDHGLQIIEDAAHSCLAKYQGAMLGTFGRTAALSFHQTKNLSCGEGGALLVNDPEIVKRAEIIRDKGTNRKAFLRSEVDRYTWMDVGSSFLPSDIVAALLWSQLQRSAAITTERRLLADVYFRGLRELEAKKYFRLPTEPEECEGNAHLFFLILPNRESRDQLLEFMALKGVQTTSHYVPLHSSPGAERFARSSGKLQVSDRVAETILRLPLYNGITHEEQFYVIESLHEFFNKKSLSIPLAVWQIPSIDAEIALK